MIETLQGPRGLQPGWGARVQLRGMRFWVGEGMRWEGRGEEERLQPPAGSQSHRLQVRNWEYRGALNEPGQTGLEEGRGPDTGYALTPLL